MPAVRLVRVEANLGLTCFRAKSGRWVGVCEPLKLTVQADTWGDLLESFRDTLDAVLSDLLATNELRQFFRDKGWVAGPIPRHDANVQFDVPFTPSVLPVSPRGSARALRQ